jgi:carboxypeptidase C (cathepsin A)
LSYFIFDPFRSVRSAGARQHQARMDMRAAATRPDLRFVILRLANAARAARLHCNIARGTKIDRALTWIVKLPFLATGTRFWQRENGRCAVREAVRQIRYNLG